MKQFVTPSPPPLLAAPSALQDGQLVTFSEVGGMVELNNHKPIRIKNCKVSGLLPLQVMQVAIRVSPRSSGVPSAQLACKVPHTVSAA